MQLGSGCATRLRVRNQVQGVQRGSGCATGFGYAHGYMLKDSTYNLFKTVPS